MPPHILGGLVSLPVIAAITLALMTAAFGPARVGPDLPLVLPGTSAHDSTSLAPRLLAYETEDAMTDAARKIFEQTSPTVLPLETLYTSCGMRRIDGCYAEGPDRIYLADDTQVGAADDMRVAAAHETLHAVWQRMSESQKSAIRPEIDAAAERLATDPEFIARMQDYGTMDAVTRYSELHSLLGTEFGDLGSPLETYYSQYFSQRSNIVAFAETAKQRLAG